MSSTASSNKLQLIPVEFPDYLISSAYKLPRTPEDGEPTHAGDIPQSILDLIAKHGLPLEPEKFPSLYYTKIPETWSQFLRNEFSEPERQDVFLHVRLAALCHDDFPKRALYNNMSNSQVIRRYKRQRHIEGERDNGQADRDAKRRHQLKRNGNSDLAEKYFEIAEDEEYRPSTMLPWSANGLDNNDYNEFAALDTQIDDSDGTNNDFRNLASDFGTIFSKFLAAAARGLSSEQWCQLNDFCERLKTPNSRNDQLRESIQTKFKEFQQTEPQLSSMPMEHLINYSGHPDNKFCLLMHYPTFLKFNKEFFDDVNPCLHYLMAKINPVLDQFFGFDLHWRQHRAFAVGCPRTNLYSPEVLALHDNLSFHILNQCPLPLLCIVGRCVQDTLKKSFPNLVELRIPISDDAEDDDFIPMYLDFRNGVLQRIIAQIPHPAFIFKLAPANRSRHARRQDAALNLLLNLGQAHHQCNPFALFEYQSNLPGRHGFYAPVVDLQNRLAEMKDASLSDKLALLTPDIVNGITAAYPDLTQRHLEQTIADGLSIKKLLYSVCNAAAAKSKVTLREVKGLQLDPNNRTSKHEFRNHDGVVDRLLGPYEYWHNRECRVPVKGEVILKVLHPKQGEKGVVEKLMFSAVGDYQHKPGNDRIWIYFESDRILFRNADGKVVWQRILPAFNYLRFGSAIMDHHKREMQRIEGRNG